MNKLEGNKKEATVNMVEVDKGGVYMNMAEIKRCV